MREAVGAGAATVASRLLAFYREPVLHRPNFIHGREVLPGGHWVFRFAQGRFPHRLMRDLAAAELAELRQAADAFIRQVCLWESATHYQLLCLTPDAGRDMIKQHYQLLIALMHPDRQGTAAEQWPNGSASRVNRAYETLGDAELREAYDRSLAKREPEPEYTRQAARAPEPRVRAASTARIGPAKAVGVVTAVVAPLMFLQMWWVADLSQEDSLTDGAQPSSWRWSRDASSAAERPRFLGAGVPAASREATDDDRPVPQAAPAPRKWWAEPEELAERPAERPTAAVNVAPPPAPPQPSAALPAQTATPSATPVLRPESELRRVQTAQAMPASAAPTARAVEPATISAKEIESIVALLVSSYEAGNVDMLMSLFDADAAGAWRTAVIRQSYHDFFRATRQRRLRVNRLEWRTGPQSAHAKGEATLLAEYFDGPSRLERKVDIELDIGLRDGRARITRVSLFPNGN